VNQAAAGKGRRWNMQLLRAQAQPDQQSEILCGWKRIATYLDMSVRSVQRYEQEYALPVRRPTGKARGAVITTIPELDRWVSTHTVQSDTGSTNNALVGGEVLRAGFNRMQVLVEEMRQLQQEMSDKCREMMASVGSLRMTVLQQKRNAAYERERVFGPIPLLMEAHDSNEESLDRSNQAGGTNHGAAEF